MQILTILLTGGAIGSEYTLTGALVAAILALSGVVVYLYKAKESAIEKKDDRIKDILKAHQDDLKEGNRDLKEVVENYHRFTQELKSVVDGKL